VGGGVSGVSLASLERSTGPSSQNVEPAGTVEVSASGMVRARRDRSHCVAVSSSSDRQTIVTLDLEGVLVPEIWIAVAERTGIEALRRTTRDEPDYDVLMRGRLALLDHHGLTMSMIAEVIGTLAPMEGARDFLDELRARTQVVILSDTFEQFGAPLMVQLGMPTLLCHRLLVEDDRIVDYRLRMADQKRHAVEAFRSLNYRVVSAGDSYNDAAMLGAADAGFWFHAPASIAAEFPQFPTTDTYEDLLAAITSALG
jgi:phosphoserine / homoserine phosphotransferase